jgi:eukaryotic-like serine/threonine-protein kinase
VAPVDLKNLEVTWATAPVLQGVAAAPNTGGIQLAVSDSGLAVYLGGESDVTTTAVQWMDSTGKTTPLRTAAADWSNPAFSPDGRTLALDIFDGTQADVWTYDWTRDTLTRLTFDPSDDQRPVWSPDSRRIVFASKRADKMTLNLYWQAADGTGEVQRLTNAMSTALPGSWHPSGKFLAYDELHGANGQDIMILPMDGDEKSGWKPGKPYTFLATPFLEGSPMFSPDGRWIAYISNESGRNEVYVRPFPGPGGKWQISNGGADDPTWSRVARQLFFASPDLHLMVSPYAVEGDSFRADKPMLWSEGQFQGRPRAPSRDLDLHPDGKRFAVAAGSQRQASKEDHVVLILNVFDELRRIAPPK